MAKMKPFRVTIGKKVPAKAIGCIITNMYIQRDPMCPRSWVEFSPKPDADTDRGKKAP